MQPRVLDDRVKDLMRRKLEQVIEMYERGEPLWIITGCSWSASAEGKTLVDDRLDITIRDSYL